MQSSELVVWSAMLGGLATLAAFTLSEALIWRSAACARAFVFVALTGSACMLLTGLPQALLPQSGAVSLLIHTLQNSLGLLGAALSLHYLTPRMGGSRKDRLVGAAIDLGSIGLMLSACTMAALTVMNAPSAWHELLEVTALINGFALVLPIAVSLWSLSLGSGPAKALLVSHVLLISAVAGLYAKGLNIDLGMGVWMLTAVCSVSFFMMSTYLRLRSDRINRRLERLNGLAQNNDPATGLPRGSVLLSKVSDAFWRGGRRQQDCTVICVHVRNLYELAETVGHHAERQILVALAARMRRAVGFRNIVGLYHPRCFVVVVSARNEPDLVEKMLMHLHYQLAKPLHIIGPNNKQHAFTPHFGMGTVSVAPSNAEMDATVVIDKAERLAVTTDTTLPYMAN